MIKFEFKSQHEGASEQQCSLSFRGESLSEVLIALQQFLSGTGYAFGIHDELMVFDHSPLPDEYEDHSAVLPEDRLATPARVIAPILDEF